MEDSIKSLPELKAMALEAGQAGLLAAQGIWYFVKSVSILAIESGRSCRQWCDEHEVGPRAQQLVKQATAKSQEYLTVAKELVTSDAVNRFLFPYADDSDVPETAAILSEDIPESVKEWVGEPAPILDTNPETGALEISVPTEAVQETAEPKPTIRRRKSKAALEDEHLAIV